MCQLFSRRLKCYIVIMRCPSSVCPRQTSVVHRRWLFTFSTSPLKPLNRIQIILTGSKTLNVLYQVRVFGPIGKIRWPPWSLIAWDIFDFSETAKQNSTKLDRKQNLNLLYQVCVFRGLSEKQDGRPVLWFAETFSTSTLKPLSRIQRNLTRNKISMSSNKFVFFGTIGKTRWPPWPLIDWDIFAFSSETSERNSTKLDRKQDLKVLYHVCVFSGRSEKQEGRHGLWLVETFSTSLKLRNRIQRNLTEIKILTSSTKFVFFGPIGKTRWPPLALISWDIFNFSSETTERNSTKLDR